MGRLDSGRPGLALVVLSVVEQRLDAVRAVLAGSELNEVAASVGVHRSTVHRWTGRYLVAGIAGLADRSHRPLVCPHQVSNGVEVVVAEMRRKHPRWGAKRIRMELIRKPVEGLVLPSQRTIVRILTRQGLAVTRPRKRPRESYRRWERPAPMQLWGIDIVGGVMLVDPTTGLLREAKVVTGIDDHSRFCVIASVVERATSRAVCLALAAALARFGVPEEILTDNGKQFTDRFGNAARCCSTRSAAATASPTGSPCPHHRTRMARWRGSTEPSGRTSSTPLTPSPRSRMRRLLWMRGSSSTTPTDRTRP